MKIRTLARRVRDALGTDGEPEHSAWDRLDGRRDPFTTGDDLDGGWWCDYGNRHAVGESCTCTPPVVHAAQMSWLRLTTASTYTLRSAA